MSINRSRIIHHNCLMTAELNILKLSNQITKHNFLEFLDICSSGEIFRLIVFILLFCSRQFSSRSWSSHWFFNNLNCLSALLRCFQKFKDRDSKEEWSILRISYEHTISLRNIRLIKFSNYLIHMLIELAQYNKILKPLYLK